MIAWVEVASSSRSPTFFDVALGNDHSLPLRMADDPRPFVLGAETLAFPDWLFSFANGGINCKGPSHPLFIVFYKPIIVTTPEPPAPPPSRP